MIRELSAWGHAWPWTAILLAGLARAAEEEPLFDYFRNSWNVIGLRDYRDGTRITPDNQLQLSGGRLAEICYGPRAVPLSRRQIKTAQAGWMPIMLLAADDGPVRYVFKLWATPLPSQSDWQLAFDGPTETENFLNWIAVHCVNQSDRPQAAQVEIRWPQGPETCRKTLDWQLQPGATADGTFRIPFAPLDDPQAFDGEEAAVWLQRTIDYWQQVMDGAAQIRVPCRKATEALWAAHVCQLIASDHGRLHGGEGFYDEFYIRDGAYQIMELEEAGLTDAAAKAIVYYLKSQRPDGRFETQTNQFDANGQALWALWQYYQITGDRTWLEGVYPQLEQAAQWVRQARRQAPADSPLAGLLPAAPADGEYLWDGKHHIVGYDLWNLRGLECTAGAARALGKTDQAQVWEEEARSYREAIAAACRRTGLAHFPPSWEQVGTHWGNTETLWPTEIFPADDPRVAATIRHARHEHGGGFVEGTIQWLGGSPAIHPYMSAYTTLASLRRGEHEQVVEDFYWYLLHSTAAHAFPEGIFQARRFAWSNTIPHVTGASNYALLLRHMLIDERGGELHLLSAVPDGWLGEGQVIRVQRAPTHFGELSFTARGTAQGVAVEFQPPQRRTPRRTVLYLPKSRPLEGTLSGVEIVVRGDQRRRWDFPEVVREYRQLAGPAASPIPGVVTWPLEAAPQPERCRTVSLEAIANTDPFTAPFGVPNPGKFLFTNLRVGRQQVAGVPFQLIDPRQNNGRGLVVLHSPKAPAQIAWPKEVRIPVGETGRRLFLLGNVHGWFSQDPGTGPWNAVAAYEIVYADGQKQAVPLITGRTIDEWAAAPEAEDVQVGLRGDPWHFNVLCVQLREARIEEIVFRDLGTPAAPLLAAITLEKAP